MSNCFSRKIDAVLRKINITKIAKEQGFLKRTPRKISAKAWVKAVCVASVGGKTSLKNIADLIGLVGTIKTSKQSVHKKISTSCLKFLQATLKEILSTYTKKIDKGIFNRILLEDSTITELDPKFSKIYPGPKNQNESDSASLKIKSIYDATAQQFIDFKITAFTENDQSLAPDILSILKPNDLILRDLGFYKINLLAQIQEKGSFFLSRHKFNTHVFSLDGKKINLLKFLKKNNSMDMQVLIGVEEKFSVRIIAVPLPDNIVNQRRRKQRHAQAHRYEVNEERIALLKWNIFVTNISAKTLSAAQIAELYGVRWLIEIIFKSWKSNLNLRALPSCSALRIQITIYTKLICIVFMHLLTLNLEKLSNKIIKSEISILKISKCFQQYAMLFFIPTIQSNPKLLERIILDCTYEKRTDRTNFFQKLESLS